MRFEFCKEDIELIIHKYLQDDLNLMVMGTPCLKPEQPIKGKARVKVTATAKPTADGWKQNGGGQNGSS